MTLSIYDACVPVFAKAMRTSAAWLDKARAGGSDEAAIMAARLAPDMHPFPRQIQIASDTAKNAGARLSGGQAPAMADDEADFDQLKARCLKTADYLEGLDRAAFDGAEDREVVLKFPNGSGYRFSGRDYLLGFALPNFYFHQSMAYALLRANGVGVGKPDFLQHLGPPNVSEG